MTDVTAGVLAGLGSAAVWPVAVRAQQSQLMRHIGVLMFESMDDPIGQSDIALFHAVGHRRRGDPIAFGFGTFDVGKSQCV
jgi:hypothetical protein